MTGKRKTEPTARDTQARDVAGYDAGAIDGPTAGASRRRPWQVLMVGECIDQIDTGASEDLARILDLFPAVSHLVVRTTAGDCQVSRDFPSDYTAEVDERLAAIFRGNPAVTSIAFPATSSRPGHTARPDDPHWSAHGKPSAEILAALTRGEIGPDEATAQLKRLYRRKSP